eukprot:Gb_18352 [translate_table: standard]
MGILRGLSSPLAIRHVMDKWRVDLGLVLETVRRVLMVQTGHSLFLCCSSCFSACDLGFVRCESVSIQVAETWEEEKVMVDGLTFTISNHLIAEVSGMPLEGAMILRLAKLSNVRSFVQMRKPFAGCSLALLENPYLSHGTE